MVSIWNSNLEGVGGVAGGILCKTTAGGQYAQNIVIILVTWLLFKHWCFDPIVPANCSHQGYTSTS
jgi:hypothetical protein